MLRKAAQDAPVHLGSYVIDVDCDYGHPAPPAQRQQDEPLDSLTDMLLPHEPSRLSHPNEASSKLGESPVNRLSEASLSIRLRHPHVKP